MNWQEKKYNFRTPKKFGEQTPDDKKERKPMRHPESEMIIGCVLWFRTQFATREIVKIDNEGKRSKKLGAIKKREGLHPGALDLFIPEPIVHQIIIRQKANNSTVEIDRHSLKILTPPFIDVPGQKQYHGMWLEGKTGRNKLSFEQIMFIEKMERRGYYCGTFYNLDEFVYHVNFYFQTNHKP